MKKVFIYALVISFAINGIVLHAHQEKKSISKKSKEIALIKAIGGIGLTGISSYFCLASSAMILIQMKDDRKVPLFGPAVLTIFLSLGIVGYKLAKSGLKDLNEIAQEN